jgi:hypothetical protein
MEFLKEVLTPELYQSLENALKGNDKIKLGNLASGEYVSKRKLDDEAQKANDFATQIAERDKQIAELTKSAGMTEELKKQIEDLQKANKAAGEDYQKKLAKQEFDYALSSELKDTYKAKDVLSVMPHLKTDAIVFKDGKFNGLAEQMTELKIIRNHIILMC